MKMTDWARGIPPAVGWWNASTERNADARRWWDGEQWSAPCYVGDTDEIAERAKNTPADPQDKAIEWRGLTEPRA